MYLISGARRAASLPPIKGRFTQWAKDLAANTGRTTNEFSVGSLYYQTINGPQQFITKTVTFGGALSDTRAYPRSGCTNPDNPGFGGYLARQTGSTSIVAKFEVPKLICTSEFTGIGPGAFLIAGPSDHHVFDFAGIILGCTDGQPDNTEALVINNVEYDYAGRSIQAMS